jgi:hypothetical protein
MIIKSKSRKDKSFLQLFNYLNRGVEKDSSSMTLNTFANGNEKEALIDEFVKNAKYIDNSRGENYIYHEVISLEDKSFKGDIEKALLELGEEYINQRTEAQHLVYMKVHKHHKNPHLHIMMSANAIESGRRYRITKKRLLEVQKSLESLSRDMGLNERVVYGNLSRKAKNLPDKAQQIERVRGKVLHTQKIAYMVKEAINLSHSKTDIEQKLLNQGYEVYFRGQTIGIKSLADGKKYRFKRLDGELENLYYKKLDELERAKNRDKTIRSRYKKSKERSLEKDISKDMEI